MCVIIGVDIGTTEIKMSIFREGEPIIDLREPTPKMIWIDTEKEELIFSPSQVWLVIKKLFQQATFSFLGSKAIISVVAHAPSLCVWDYNGQSVGVPYLSYYGDSKKNKKHQRVEKSIRREHLLFRVCGEKQYNYISSLTGYIVYMLSGICSIDSISAWEIGIESQKDYDDWKNRLPYLIVPNIETPLKSFKIIEGTVPGLSGRVIVGSTDSAVLPLVVAPNFCDYYVYLGTWGSLLRTKLVSYDEYNKRFHGGQLHEWLVSVPNFAEDVKINTNLLNSFFSEIGMNTHEGNSIAICGGLTKAFPQIIRNLANEYLLNKKTTIVPLQNNALGACNLGILSEGIKHND